MGPFRMTRTTSAIRIMIGKTMVITSDDSARCPRTNKKKNGAHHRTIGHLRPWYHCAHRSNGIPPVRSKFIVGQCGRNGCSMVRYLLMSKVPGRPIWFCSPRFVCRFSFSKRIVYIHPNPISSTPQAMAVPPTDMLESMISTIKDVRERGVF